MNLFRRKLWGDRVIWFLVTAASVIVVFQWQTRGGTSRLYILIVWAVFVAWLLGYSELRIGRKQLRRGRDAMFLGLAAFVGEQRVDPEGQRHRVWTGIAAGALAFEPQGIRWVPKLKDEQPGELSFAWSDVYSWRFGGVIPFVWRASGYLLISLYGGRELLFHIHGLRTWRAAVREAAIVGPTLLSKPREPLPPHAEGSTPEPVVVANEPPLPPVVEEVPVAQDAAVVTPEFPVPAEPAATSYEAVIGLECHVELATDSKMFCACPTTFGTEPNTQICPVCTGQPGTLPVPNRKAIEHTIRIGLALNAEIVGSSTFHRKNYFYPDMPKNYQISQYEIPLCRGGVLTFDLDGAEHSVRVHRVHLEEDTGKTIHGGEGGRIGDADSASIDYNRAGIPLVEIVSEPDIKTPEEARAYLAELRTLLLTLGVSDVRMEEGSLRCDANISMRPAGTTAFGTKVEVKNMNSLRSVQRALAYEIERQTEMLKSGKPISQETRHFEEEAGRTIGGRSKEYSADYRYFPDPDLVPLEPPVALIDEIRSELPELPAKKYQRYIALGLGPADARTFVASPGLSAAFDEAVRVATSEAPAIARWYLGELAQIANERNVEPHEVGVAPAFVAELQRLVDEGKVSISLAKGDVLRKVVETGKAPGEIVAEAGLTQISDESELTAIIDQAIADNPDVVAQITAGKRAAMNALVGPVMKATKGQANAQVVRQLLEARFPE